MFYLIKGIILGFAIAAPVGPMAMLCINRTLSGKFRNGMFTGLGIATADMCYAAVAAYGLSAILSFLIFIKPALMGIGGIFLIYLAIKSFTKKAELSQAKLAGESHKEYLSAFLLTLTNPMTILTFIAIFAGIGGESSYLFALFLALGIFLGSTIWWVILILCVVSIKHMVGIKFLKWVNVGSGTILLLFGLYAFVTLFR
ncbi:MAG: LysE family translocator [Fusobacteria bacterium]|nr:LysE family translocator [Fusobacteriota bacterium]